MRGGRPVCELVSAQHLSTAPTIIRRPHIPLGCIGLSGAAFWAQLCPCGRRSQAIAVVNHAASKDYTHDSRSTFGCKTSGHAL
eukprot:1787602-Prymnesium_polylepis.2